ncbi:MAG: glycosyltransferase family 2 protein [Verrucomicrobiae bacterium]|nr:glycosyltransferase family 2 protein [Verrucomicrobiae bacterium]
MTEPYLSVVIPCYNEEKRLPRAIREVAGFVAAKGEFEIVVVDDGSRDRTARVAEDLAKAYPQVRLISYQPNHGKGYAVRTGMLAARGRYVLFTDADQSTPISELDKLLIKVEREGYDMAIASRWLPQSEVIIAQSKGRRLASRLFWLAVWVLAVRGVADTQCGFKCMRREVAQKIFSQMHTDSPVFDVEMLILAARAGYRIAEVPVKWIHDHDTRIPYNLRRGWQALLEIFRIMRRHRVWWPVRIRR